MADTFDLEAMQAAIERCRLATGPDAELDGAVHSLLFGSQTGADLGLAPASEATVFYTDPETGYGCLTPIAFSASVENAERALPDDGGYPEWQITRRHCTGYHANIGMGEDGVGFETSALALLAGALAQRLSTLTQAS